MPMDEHGAEDDERADKREEGGARFNQFDCPCCNANNPCEPFGEATELLCNYCGSSYIARVGEGGRLRLREV